MKFDQDLLKLLVQVLVIYGPSAVKAIKDIFSKQDVTLADIDALLASVSQKSYDDYIAGRA